MDQDGNGHGWGHANFAKRSYLIKSLVEGTLIIEVRMMKAVASTEPPFIPKNPINKIILEKFMDEENGVSAQDVCCACGGGRSVKLLQEPGMWRWEMNCVMVSCLVYVDL